MVSRCPAWLLSHPPLGLVKGCLPLGLGGACGLPPLPGGGWLPLLALEERGTPWHRCPGPIDTCLGDSCNGCCLPQATCSAVPSKSGCAAAAGRQRSCDFELCCATRRSASLLWSNKHLPPSSTFASKHRALPSGLSAPQALSTLCLLPRSASSFVTLQEQLLSRGSQTSHNEKL